MFYVLLYVTLCPFEFCNHLDWEERELVVLLSLHPSWCLVIVAGLFLAVTWVCLQFVIVVFADHTHYFYTMEIKTGSLTSTILKYALKLGRWSYQHSLVVSCLLKSTT